MPLSFGDVFNTMNNAHGKSEEYHPEKILEEQQRFEDRNIENSMRYALQSTPTKRTLAEDDRGDGEYENHRSMSEDDRVALQCV